MGSLQINAIFYAAPTLFCFFRIIYSVPICLQKNMVEKKDEGNPVTLDKVSRLINVTSISLSGMIQHQGPTKSVILVSEQQRTCEAENAFFLARAAQTCGVERIPTNFATKQELTSKKKQCPNGFSHFVGRNLRQLGRIKFSDSIKTVFLD